MTQANQFRNRKTEAAKAQTTAALVQGLEALGPISSPAVKIDEAFGNEIIARRDQAIVEEQAARQQLEARRSQFDRDLERLHALFRADEEALTDTIGRCERVQNMSNAALEAAKSNEAAFHSGATNVQ